MEVCDEVVGGEFRNAQGESVGVSECRCVIFSRVLSNSSAIPIRRLTLLLDFVRGRNSSKNMDIPAFVSTAFIAKIAIRWNGMSDLKLGIGFVFPLTTARKHDIGGECTSKSTKCHCRVIHQNNISHFQI